MYPILTFQMKKKLFFVCCSNVKLNITRNDNTVYQYIQGTWNERFNKEQQDYLEALNKQEVAEKVSNRLLAIKKKYSLSNKLENNFFFSSLYLLIFKSV